MKTCTKCGTSFDGPRYCCRTCASAATATWRQRNKERNKRNGRRYYQNNKDKRRASMKKFRDKHPEVNKAHNAVKVAIRSGKMVREQCKVFDCFDIGEAHHEDYSKPLDVVWLCTKHHKQLHKENNMNQYITVRDNYGEFYVNVINYDGSTAMYGQHGYVHKRSARRAAIALAKKMEISYRQDLEYSDTPSAFVAEKATA